MLADCKWKIDIIETTHVRDAFASVQYSQDIYNDDCWHNLEVVQVLVSI